LTRILIALLSIFISSQAVAQDWLTSSGDSGNYFTATINEPSRQYRNTGTITLRDPIYGFVLGTYRFATGGRGRGSAPLTDYAVGKFRDDGPIGSRWMLRQVGREDGEVWDPHIGDMRTWIELHKAHTGYSLGCIAVFGNWGEFVHKLDYILSRAGTVRFILR